MSMKRLALLSAIHSDGRLNSTEMIPTPGSPPVPVHGVNVMLGGAMLSGIILVVFILCYCCHKTNRKCTSSLPSYWRDPALSMEIYTVEAAQTWLVSEDLSNELHRPATPGPPPAYDAVVPLEKTLLCKEDDTGLPSYETAVQHLASDHQNTSLNNNVYENSTHLQNTSTNNNTYENTNQCQVSVHQNCITGCGESIITSTETLQNHAGNAIFSNSFSTTANNKEYPASQQVNKTPPCTADSTPIFRVGNVRPSSGSSCGTTGRRASSAFIVGLSHMNSSNYFNFHDKEGTEQSLNGSSVHL